jgi:hypothetical protein
MIDHSSTFVHLGWRERERAWYPEDPEPLAELLRGVALAVLGGKLTELLLGCSTRQLAVFVLERNRNGIHLMLCY